MAGQKQCQQYLRTQIQTASKEQLVLMLFDGVVRFCEQGRAALEKRDFEASHQALTRTQNIVLELLYGLDRARGGEIADNLVRLYTYALQRLIQANMTHESASLAEVQKIFRDLREAWAGALDKVKREAQGQAQPASPSAPQAAATTTKTPEPAVPPEAPPAAKPAAASPKPAAPQAPRSGVGRPSRLAMLAPDARVRLSVQG